MLADMATEVEAAHLLVYRAASMADEKDPGLAIFSAMSKMKASDTVMHATTDTVQVMGGMVKCEIIPWSA
jgi:alkylation response protein AidB-like acyl-CoA dehydrogenase